MKFYQGNNINLLNEVFFSSSRDAVGDLLPVIASSGLHSEASVSMNCSFIPLLTCVSNTRTNLHD